MAQPAAQYVGKTTVVVAAQASAAGYCSAYTVPGASLIVEWNP
jgi:hypothetical protein